MSEVDTRRPRQDSLHTPQGVCGPTTVATAGE